MKIVLPIAAAGIALATIITLGTEWDAALNPYVLFGTAIGQTLAGIISGLIQAFAIITIIFIVLERKKVVFNDSDMLSNLPPVPKTEARIEPYEPIGGIIWSVIAVVFFLGFPQLAGAWIDGIGWISVFVPDVIRGFWIFIILWAVFGIVKESVKLIEGQYTKRLAIVTVACNVLTAICAAIVFLNGEIINHEFADAISSLITQADGKAIITALFGSFNLVLLGIVILALVMDLVTAAVKARKRP